MGVEWTCFAVDSVWVEYTMTEGSGNVLQGAVFCFVQGTDPEVLMIIEAVEQAEGSPRYQYGLARMSMVPLKVFCGGGMVMETDWAVSSPGGPYFLMRSVD